MKKLAFILAVVFLSVSTFGQTTAPVAKTTTKDDQTKTVAATQTQTVKTVADTTKTKVAAKTIKKDGTPDKRFKANKTTVKPTGPVKKDGTPDMRYKTNKDTTKIKK